MKTSLLFLVLALFCICHITNAYDKERCDAEPTLKGSGTASVLRYAFIKTTRTCNAFYWGGEGCTGNMFDNLPDCQKACFL